LTTKKYPAKSSVAIVLLILSIPVFFPIFSPVICDQEEEYAYYCVIPNKIYQYVLNDTTNPQLGYNLRQDVDTVRTKVLVEITATEDNTNVRVYSLNNNSLVSQTNLNAMQEYFMLFPNGSMFKVVTDKYASVMLLNYPDVPPLGSKRVDPNPTTFQASVDGTYVGKEFIFMASWNPASDQTESYRFFALEKADVKVINETGGEQDISLDVNSYKDVSLSSFESYRVESTGNIMILSNIPLGEYIERFYYFVPSAEGGFVGKTFYTSSSTSWDQKEDYGYRISATQDSEVKIWDLDTKGEIMDFTVKAREGMGVRPKANAILVQSTEPITLEWLANGTTTTLYGTLWLSYAGDWGETYGAGIAYIGIKPNEETPFFLPTNSSVEAYVFAYNQTTVTLDGSPVPIEAGSFFPLTAPGTHEITSDQNIVVEVISWPLYPTIQGLTFGGVEIPCIQLVNAVPNVSLTPLQGSSQTTYIIIGAAVAALAVGLGYFVMKRRTK
jgi:hypothetical protein